MTIIYHDKTDEIPIAVVDGYMPSVKDIERQYNIIKRCGLPDPNESKGASAYNKFEAILEQVNDYHKLEFDSSIDHFLFFHMRSIGNNNPTLKNTSFIHDILTPILTPEKRPDYCVNIVLSNNSDNWCKLKFYILDWMSISGFQLKDNSQYDNFSRYNVNCQKLMKSAIAFYNNPLLQYFNSIDNSKYRPYKIHS